MANQETKTPTVGKAARPLNPNTATQRIKATARQGVVTTENAFAVGSGGTATKMTHSAGLEAIAAAKVRTEITIQERKKASAPQPETPREETQQQVRALNK